MAVERFPIEAGHIQLFARAVGDGNPIYFDPEHAAGTDVGAIIAPPTFAQASAQFDDDYPLRPKLGTPWFGSGKEASGITRAASGEGGDGASAGLLHAEQHFEYHRHVSPGDVLTAITRPGDKWEKQSKRAGLLKFTESITEYRDEAGELVITARSVGVITEKVVGS